MQSCAKVWAMKVWEGLYMRWIENKSLRKNELDKAIKDLRDKESESEKKLKEKEKNLEMLKERAKELGISINN